jgi:hypothetical protein
VNSRLSTSAKTRDAQRGPTEPRPDSGENASNPAGGGNREDDRDERQRRPEEHDFIRTFLQGRPEPTAGNALHTSERDDCAQAEHDQIGETSISLTARRRSWP